MEKNLYIDASHPNETRVVLKSGDNIEDYEYEGLKINLIKLYYQILFLNSHQILNLLFFHSYTNT